MPEISLATLSLIIGTIAVLGGVEDRVVRSFREGGGVHYCHYDRFHEVMADERVRQAYFGDVEVGSGS